MSRVVTNEEKTYVNLHRTVPLTLVKLIKFFALITRLGLSTDVTEALVRE